MSTSRVPSKSRTLIRTKLIVSALFTIGLALAVAFTVSLQYKNVRQASRTERFAHGVIRDVSDLNSLGYAYLLLKDRRPQIQWQIKYGSLGKTLSEHVAGSAEEQGLISRLRSEHGQLKGLFDTIVGRAEKGRVGAKQPTSPYDELSEGITAQLLARSEVMVNDASLLEGESARRMDAVLLRSFLLVLVSCTLLIFSAALTSSLLVRSIGGPIRTLKQGAQRIADGDLAYRVDVAGNDEIGLLSTAFNEMTEKLAASYGKQEQEIAERRRAEGALKELNQTLEQRVESRTAQLTASEQRWATTLSSIGDAVIATDVTGSIVFMNSVAQELTGWTLSEASMKPVTEVFNIINEHARTQVESPVAKVLREGMVVGLANHTLLVRKDGTEVPIDDSGAPIRGSEGRTTGVVLVFRDITERKRSEESLRQAHEELEQRVLERTEALRRQADLLELAYNVIIVRDLDGRVTFWNARAEELYGFTRDEALGQLTQTLLHTQLPVPFEERMTVLTTAGQWEGELTHTRKDGSHVVVLSRQALQRDEAGQPLAIMEINLDITEQRHVEEQLRQAQKMEALGTLSGGIAHDFNNILAAIIGFTELVEGHVDKGSRDAHHLGRVMQAAIRGRELVRQMLTFSRKADQEKKPLLLSSIVEETVKLIRASTPSTINIRVSTTESKLGLILADPTQMQQVLLNLCTNAAYAMREKGGALDILLGSHSVSPSNGNPPKMRPGPYVKLIVRDTGSGISPDVMGKLFDPFFTTKKLGEGTGLGLSVVHGIVTQHEGYVTAESEQGVGSTFTVYLPQIAEALETVAVSDDLIPTGSERILFVDDEEALVEMGEDILAELGYEVTSRMNGRQALALLAEDPSRFDLVITDQTMPEMTGVDLAKEILAIRADMPIIMCTGFSHVVDADKARQAGIRAFTMKPLTRKEIAKTVRKVLDG